MGPARPIPSPIPNVSARTSAGPGAPSRRSPKTMTSIAQAASAQRAPRRRARAGASGAKMPMHNTGIELSSPATPCEMPRLAWMLGSSGPMAMTCGRKTRATASSATSGLASDRTDRPSRAARLRSARPGSVHDPRVPSAQVVVEERLRVELCAAEDEPDRVDRLVSQRRQAVGDRRIDRDRVARLEDVLVKTDADLEAPAEDVAPLVPRMPLEGIGRARRAADLVGHVEELDPRLGQCRQPLPVNPGGEPNRVPVRGALDGWSSRHGPAHRRLGSCDRGGFGRPPVVEQQLIERHVELRRDGIQRADRRVRTAGLDLGDETRRHSESFRERPKAQAPGLARFAEPLADLRIVRAAGASRAGGGHGCPHPPAQNIIRPLSTTRSMPSTDGFSSRKRVPSTMSAIVASFLVMVFDVWPSRIAGGLPCQYGLSPVIPGWIALTRIGASSQARLRVSPDTPPLTVETVVEPGYGRSFAWPPNSTIELSGESRSRST